MQMTPTDFESHTAQAEPDGTWVEEADEAGRRTSDVDHSRLEANADQRKSLRRHVDKAELRLAFRDLAEGVRGFIRVAPLTAVLAGVAVGVALGASRTKPAKRRA